MKPTFKLMLLLAAAVVITSALAPTVSGQQRSRGGLRESRESSAQLERELAKMEEEINMPPRRRERRLPFAQISEDFMRLQIINNDLALAVRDSDAPDFKFVAKSAAEIKKLAQRLKENLVLPEPEKDSRPAKPELKAEVEELKATVSVLGKLIFGFAHNPIFKEANVVDAQLSAKARRDLEEIIELSDRLRKSSESLNKALKKS